MTHIKEAMKAKAQEFTAYEIVYPAGRRKIDLVLLSEPIYVYTDDKNGIQLGAMFAFCLGTNPEVLLVFECRPGQTSFGCEVVRVGGEEMHVLWKGRGIWKSERGDGQPRKRIPSSYASFLYSDLESGNL